MNDHDIQGPPVEAARPRLLDLARETIRRRQPRTRPWGAAFSLQGGAGRDAAVAGGAGTRQVVAACRTAIMITMPQARSMFDGGVMSKLRYPLRAMLAASLFLASAGTTAAD